MRHPPSLLPMPLLESRHRRPPLGDGLVDRPRLIRRLVGSAHLPLALLVAPAGYGKTTILSQWAEQDRRPVAWVRLDEGDDDPRRLLASIASVLGEVEPIDHDLRAALGAPRPRVADLRAGLIRLLESRTCPFVLVLDDVHLVRAEKSLRALSEIVDHLPSGSQLALASRDEPRMPVGRLRANRNVVELRFRDLAMTSSEAAALLRLAGVDLVEDQVEAIARLAEGWPAALYLAAMSLGESADPAVAAMGFGGHDRLIADYLRDEVLSVLAPDRIAFLTRTAVLDRLSGPLCDAVLQRADSGRVLAELERANVLLFADEDAGYNRHHRLLAQMLRAELRQAEPELEPELHRRAAAWHVGRGDIDQAVEHAIAARDAGLAGDLLWKNLLRYVSYGRNAPVQGWLNRLTDEEIAPHPSLALVAAGSHLARGDRNRVEHWSAVASRRLQEGAPDSAHSLEGGVMILRAAAGTEGIARMLEDADSAYQLFPEDDPWRSLCCLLIGTAQHLNGGRDRAFAWLEEGARRGAVQAPTIQALCLAQLAILAVDERDWANANAYAMRARGQIERFGALDYPTSGLVLAVASAAHAQAGRVDEATIDARRASVLAARLVDFAPWYEVEIRIVLARTALRLSDVAGVRSQLGEVSRLLRHFPDATVLHEWTEDLWLRADSACGHPNGDRWSLTTAELRVLQFLPTHFSFPEIADQLNVSANTVKTHTRAVYRKLDAGSRGQAVDHARVAGLIDPGLTLAEAA
jgi:LuxR family transcriptional regulator, maltose regulon positive regulatory protein